MRREGSGLCFTDVRVERLNDISEEDAIEEGLESITEDGGRTWKYGMPDRDGLPGTDDMGWPLVEWSTKPIHAYRKLWESIHGPGSWDANPWVWARTFRGIGRNVDVVLKNQQDSLWDPARPARSAATTCSNAWTSTRDTHPSQ